MEHVFFALLNLWLDDGGSSGIIANFYDKHGLTQQGNVEFMRNFGLEKTIYFVLIDAAPKQISSLSTENHVSATFTLISICLSFQDLLQKMECF